MTAVLSTPVPDVAPDPGLRLRLPRFVLEVRRDVSCRDVRVLADLGVPDVGEVRDLRAGADGRLLHLDEAPDLRPLAEDRAGAHVGERADLDAGGDPHVAPDDRERMDGDVGLDLDACLDPCRARVDDGDAGEHVRVVDPVAERGRAAANSTRVLIPSTSNGSAATCTATASPSPTSSPIVSVR